MGEPAGGVVSEEGDGEGRRCELWGYIYSFLRVGFLQPWIGECLLLLVFFLDETNM
jgi:hypothetical protein